MILTENNNLANECTYVPLGLVKCVYCPCGTIPLTTGPYDVIRSCDRPNEIRYGSDTLKRCVDTSFDVKGISL